MGVKRTGGMTLLEVLVALVIFAVGCLAVMRTVGQQIRSLGVLEEKTVADWVADNQLALLYLNGQRPSLLWQQGKSEMLDKAWYWRYRSLATTDQQIYAVDIEVSLDPDFNPVIAQLRAWVK